MMVISALAGVTYLIEDIPKLKTGNIFEDGLPIVAFAIGIFIVYKCILGWLCEWWLDLRESERE